MRAKRSFSFVLALFGVTVPAFGGSHMWRFSEIFSDASGTIQFIEFWCTPGSDAEIFMNGLTVTTANGTFTFPGNLIGPTGNKRMLLATSAFAALPGAPTPDYLIPANFIPLNGGTIRYRPEANYDNWTYGAGDIPTNGTDSVRFTSWNSGQSGIIDTWIIEANSPSNYQGGSGSVNATCVDGDGDGYGNPGNPACANGSATDCNDSNASVHPNAAEASVAQCTDGLDNDCDGLTDCADSTCASVVGACVPTVSEWGVAVLTLTMLCAGSILLRGRA